MAPKVKVERDKVKGTVMAIPLVPTFNLLLRELFIQPFFDCMTVMNRCTILQESIQILTLFIENAWKSSICQQWY
jgi:hypothetical protein